MCGVTVIHALLRVNNSLSVQKSGIGSLLSTLGSFSRLARLPANNQTCSDTDNDEHPIGLFKGCIPLWRVGIGFSLIVCSLILLFWRGKDDGRLAWVKRRSVCHWLSCLAVRPAY